MKRLVAVAVVLALTACSRGDDDSDDADSTGTMVAEVDEFTLASLNVLHGVFCDDGDHCDAPSRMQLLGQHIEETGCPEVVTLQEVAPWIDELVRAQLPTLCDGAYAAHTYTTTDVFDGALVLTQGVVAREAVGMPLAGGLRPAQRIDVETDLGPIAIVNTHTGTGADDRGAGGTECSAAPDQCPPPCDATGTLFECQLVQVRELVADAPMAIIAGDLNLVTDAPPLSILYDAGFVDTWLAAGNGECDSATGEFCTSGRVDAAVEVLREPSALNSSRVDYVLLRPGDACVPDYGAGTGPFAHEPVTDGPGGLAWVSDHSGVALQLACE